MDLYRLGLVWISLVSLGWFGLVWVGLGGLGLDMVLGLWLVGLELVEIVRLVWLVACFVRCWYGWI